MRVSLKPCQPLLAAMSLANIAQFPPRQINSQKMPGSASSNRKNQSGDFWTMSRLKATHVPTPKQAAVSHRTRFMGQDFQIFVSAECARASCVTRRQRATDCADARHGSSGDWADAAGKVRNI